MGRSVATDKDGNVLVTGYYHGPEAKFGSITLVPSGYVNFFVAKYDSSGTALWIKNFGDLLADASNAVATDAMGNIFVTGQFTSSSIVLGSETLHASSYENFLLMKLDPDGNVLWAKTTKGNHNDSMRGEAIVVDHAGNIIVSGTVSGTYDLDNGINLTGSGYFLTKYDTHGNISWAKLLGLGLSESYGRNSVTIDPTNNIYVTGAILVTLFVDQVEHLVTKSFLTKLEPNGNIVWTKYLEGSGYYPYNYASGVTTDDWGQVYITGSYHQTISFGDTTFFSPGSLGNMSSIFIAKFDANGNTVWARSATRGRGEARGIVVDKSGSVFITGNLFLFGLNRDTLNFGDIYLKSSIQNSSTDHSFIAQYSAEGVALWAYLVDSESPNISLSIASDGFGSIYMTGQLNYNPNFNRDPLLNFGDITVQSLNAGMFVAKLKPCRSLLPQIKPPVSFCVGKNVVLNSPSATNNLWSTGSSEPSITVTQAGNYIVKVTNQSQCTTSIISTEVIINPLPEVFISPSSDSMCEGNTVTLTATSAKTYLWNTGATSPSIDVTQPGSYEVSITDNHDCTASSAPIQIKQDLPPPDIELQSNCSQLFVNHETLVAWFKNDEIIFPTEAHLQAISPLDSGVFYVEASNVCGTKRSNSIHFKAPRLDLLFQPNVITPNGDALNEYLVLDEKLSGSALLIVNRWGNEVYYSSNYQNTWNGADLVEGIYYYSIQNSCFKEKIKGALTFVR